MDEGVIKIYIMCHKNIILQELVYFLSNFRKDRRICQHRIADAGKCRYKCRHPNFRVDQGGKMLNRTFTVMHKYGYLRDAVSGCMATGGFYIYYCVQVDLKIWRFEDLAMNFRM